MKNLWVQKDFTGLGSEDRCSWCGLGPRSNFDSVCPTLAIKI